MRQLRLATGVSHDQTAEILNETLTELYGADVLDRPRRGRSSSSPHRVTASFLRSVERGEHSRVEPKLLPAWIDLDAVGRDRANASRVPPWLVRAYDVAFGADGFLADVYAWSEILTADQSQMIPRRLRDLPGHVPDGAEYEFLTRDLGDPADLEPDERALLTVHAERLARLNARLRGTRASWAPIRGDVSGHLGEEEEDAPEGKLIGPGERFVVRYVLHNIGVAPWRHRLLYRVGFPAVGITGPALVPIPDTDPGGAAEVACVLRAPRRPGTYRVSMKMGWPDGTYCLPTTLLGLVVTIVVPAEDLIAPLELWPDHVG